MGFSRQEYWSGLPFPPPGDLPDPEIEPMSPVLARWILYHSATRKALMSGLHDIKHPICLNKIIQARILEWVAISSSRGSLRPRNQTLVSCIGRRVLYHSCHLESPFSSLLISESSESSSRSPMPPCLTALPGAPRRNLGAALSAPSVLDLLGQSPVPPPGPAPGFVPSSTPATTASLKTQMGVRPPIPTWGPGAFTWPWRNSSFSWAPLL